MAQDHDARTNDSLLHQRLSRVLRIIILIAGDIIFLQVAVFLAYFTRFAGGDLSEYIATYKYVGIIYTVGALLIFAWRGMYRSLWRYAGLQELANILLASIASTILLWLLSTWFGLPRSAAVMQFFTLVVVIAAWRLTLRALRRSFLEKADRALLANSDSRHGNSVLIIGAGSPGASLVTPLQSGGRRVVGFVDDDPGKQGMRIHGVSVLGTLDDCAELIARYNVREVLFALPPDQVARQREVVQSLAGTNVVMRIIPTMNELIDGKVEINRIRPIIIDDLLGREPVKQDYAQISNSIRDQVVLVTGAGGSIGSELCRQICTFSPARLIMLGHGENSIFEAALDIGQAFPQISRVEVIADIRDKAKIDLIFATYRPALVFHAAANKHVHFMEDYPEEAVKTNVFGTQNVAQAALKYGAKKFVMISTDKAVNPTSVMGCSKRVAEMMVQDLNQFGQTRFMSVRFGNVLGSRGSVVPIFQKQIAAGGPVTVTDPEMRRYFMTIPEAVQLVLQAQAMGQGGEVFVLDMGEPVKIVDLAKNMISLSGYRPGIDIEICFTGRKPGEKLYEEILLQEEGVHVTEHSRIFMTQNARMAHDDLLRELKELEQVTFKGETEKIIPYLQKLVTNYKPYRPQEQCELEVAVAAEEK